jgi:phosphate acetyltransferase
MIVPVLVGPTAKIEACGRCRRGWISSGLEIVDAPHSHAAAEVAVALVHEGRAGALMKGKLHTDELLIGRARQDAAGLRTERRLSHVFRARRAGSEPDAVRHRRGDQHLARSRSA